MKPLTLLLYIAHTIICEYISFSRFEKSRQYKTALRFSNVFVFAYKADNYIPNNIAIFYVNWLPELSFLSTN